MAILLMVISGYSIDDYFINGYYAYSSNGY
jgi:hypothetical protein